MNRIDPNKTYYLVPGKVKSKSDGDIHHISAQQLARLYGVSLAEPNVKILRLEYIGHSGHVEQDGDVYLYPDYTGVYELPD